MSSDPNPQAIPVVPVASTNQREMRIYAHSALFYWWPVWAVGFLMAALTSVQHKRMAIIPSGTDFGYQAEGSYVVGEKAEKKDFQSNEVLVYPKGKHPAGQPAEPPHLLFMSDNKNLGVLFVITLLIIIVISNVPLRGLWSLIVVLMIVLTSVMLALWGWWDNLLAYYSYLQIHINLGGYLFLSLVLFIIWAVTVFIFDHRTYVIVSSGQVRACMAVGAGETVYDTTGINFEKKQDDLFRHWIVGLGSGDLIIKWAATKQEIDLPNVLFVGSKIREIEKLIKEREVV